MASTWLLEASQTLTVHHKPYILNVKGTGYFRVNYDEENWSLLIDELKSNAIPNIDRLNRAQMIDDIMNLARAGKVDYNLALTLLQYLTIEDDYIPWKAASMSLEFLHKRLLSSTEDMGLMKSFVYDILEVRYHSLGFKPTTANEDHLTTLGRITANHLMCIFDDDDCVTKAQTYYDSWMKDDETIPVDIQDVVFEVAIRTGNSTHWQFMFEKFKSATLDSDRQKYLFALSASEDEGILTTFLQKTIDRTDGSIRLQDCIYIFRGVSGNKVGRQVIMDWMTNNYDDILDGLGGSTRFASEIIAGYATTANIGSDITNITNFVDAHQSDLQGVMSTIDNSLILCSLNVQWNQMHRETVKDWLKRNYADDNDDDDSSGTVSWSPSHIMLYCAALMLYVQL